PAPASRPAAPETPASPPEIVRIPPDTRVLRFNGSNMRAGPATPVVRLDGRPLEHAQAGDDGLEVHLPDGVRRGALELDFGEGEQALRWNDVEQELGLSRTYQVEIADADSAERVVDALRSVPAVESARVQTLATTPAATAAPAAVHRGSDAAWAPHLRIHAPE